MPFEHPTSAPSADVAPLETSPATVLPSTVATETDAATPGAAVDTSAADADATAGLDAAGPVDESADDAAKSAGELDADLADDAPAADAVAARSGEPVAARGAAVTAVRAGAAATRSAALAAAAGGRRRVAAAGAALAGHTPHRLALPVVLVAATATGLAGLSGGTTSTTTAQVRAAAASAPLALEPFAKPLDLLDGPAATAAPTPTAAPAKKKAAPPRPAKASRARRAAPPAPRFVRPVSAGISSYFGRRWGRMHEGLDFSAGYGAPIRAVTSGRVISAGYDGGYGNMVLIRHSDGVVTAYAHMSRILVRGGSVDAGEVIGRVGSTGNSTGAHLHFEVRVGGSAVNPLKWLRTKGVRV